MTASGVLLIQRCFWLVGILLPLVLFGRLFLLKLAGNYRFFLAYLLFDTVRSLVLWFYSPGSSFFLNIWLSTEPIVWILYVLVVLELCSLIFKDYRGIHALGKWIIYGSSAISVLVSIITVLPTWRRSTDAVVSFQRYLMIERGVDFAIVLLLLLLLAFLVLFPIQLSRNVIIHSILYAIFFMSYSMGILIVNLTGYRLSIALSTCLMCVSVLCMIGWLILMTREGEQKIMAIRHLPVDESRLVAQLTEINATLLRARKYTSPEASGVRR